VAGRACRRREVSSAAACEVTTCCASPVGRRTFRIPLEVGALQQGKPAEVDQEAASLLKAFTDFLGFFLQAPLDVILSHLLINVHSLT
jgi:hypothetical protein